MPPGGTKATTTCLSYVTHPESRLTRLQGGDQLIDVLPLLFACANTAPGGSYGVEKPLLQFRSFRAIPVRFFLRAGLQKLIKDGRWWLVVRDFATQAERRAGGIVGADWFHESSSMMCHVKRWAVYIRERNGRVLQHSSIIRRS